MGGRRCRASTNASRCRAARPRPPRPRRCHAYSNGCAASPMSHHRRLGPHGSDDKVEALDLGADDYITKPFCSRSCWRASGPRPAERRPRGRLCVLSSTGSCSTSPTRGPPGRARGAPDPDGVEIVETLARRRGRLVRQTELLHAVWGPAYDRQTNYLRVHMASIRRKLERDPSHPTPIGTVMSRLARGRERLLALLTARHSRVTHDGVR